jgi:hypothetical protein
VTTDRVEQLKARLKREDEAKEKAFQKRLQEIRESQAEFRAERKAKERAEQKERNKLHENLRQKCAQEMKDSALRSRLDAGGTGEEFEREWPAMRTQMLRERATQGDSALRRGQRQRSLKEF